MNIANPKEPIEVIYRGTDIETFKPRVINLDLKRSLLLPEDSSVVTYVGRLIKEKGVYDLLKAFSILATKLPKVYLMIVGGGPERKNLVALSRKMGVEKQVIFTGPVKNEEMPSYLSITDVMAFPSYAEGLPNAVVEAVACGKPIVATDVDGIPEIVTTGVNGLLVPVGNIEMLASNLVYVLTDTALREKMERESRKIAVTNFDSRKNAEKLGYLFKSVIEDHLRFKA